MLTELLIAATWAALFAGVVTSILVPFVGKVAIALRAVDYPGGRRFHGTAVPRLGGVAIGCGLASGAGAMALAKWNAWGPRVAKSELAAVLVGCAIVFLLGVVDDFTGVSTPNKLLAEIVAASLIAGVGWKFSVLGLPGGADLRLGSAGALLTVVWIVGVTNAINLLDGLDGLASGVVAIVAASLLIYAVLQGNSFMVVLMGGVVGACLGFLRHNRSPAQIFMGDSGSLTLGFLLAVASVHSTLKAPAAVAILVPILALGVPVIDTLVVMLVRFLAQPIGGVTGRLLRVFKADRNHLHQMMQKHGAKGGTVVRTIYVLVLISCAMAMTVGLTKHSGLGIALVIVEIGAIVAVRSLGFAGQARRLSIWRRRELMEEITPGEPEGGGVDP
jgi:UDP-GlcNAc:undecaprenyl-phosphate/decaprenyl-phosphate GlcNAc-1-phosphate transferase